MQVYTFCEGHKRNTEFTFNGLYECCKFRAKLYHSVQCSIIWSSWLFHESTHRCPYHSRSCHVQSLHDLVHKWPFSRIYIIKLDTISALYYIALV